MSSILNRWAFLACAFLMIATFVTVGRSQVQNEPDPGHNHDAKAGKDFALTRPGASGPVGSPTYLGKLVAGKRALPRASFVAHTPRFVRARCRGFRLDEPGCRQNGIHRERIRAGVAEYDCFETFVRRRVSSEAFEPVHHRVRRQLVPLVRVRLFQELCGLSLRMFVGRIPVSERVLVVEVDIVEGAAQYRLAPIPMN